jgi:thiamine kinase-like enzyme
MDDFEQRIERDGAEALRSLRAEVDAIDVCDDLPHRIVHPDMVPENAIEVKDRSLVIVDWANAGLGPRLWSLGMTLFAAGARDLRLVEKVISRYVKRSALETREIQRLEGAIYARPLTIHAWEVVHGISTLAETPHAIQFFKRVSAQTAEAARVAFALER